MVGEAVEESGERADDEEDNDDYDEEVEVVDELGVDKQVESNQDRQFADGQDLNELKNLHIDILRHLAMKG